MGEESLGLIPSKPKYTYVELYFCSSSSCFAQQWYKKKQSRDEVYILQWRKQLNT